LDPAVTLVEAGMAEGDGHRLQIMLDPQERQLSVRTQNGAREERIAWDSVQRVVAFKRDLFARDLICLLFETDSEGVIELDETMGGWQTLVAVLPARLTGALAADDWLPRVMFPAFQGNPMEIYRRQP
jgi:hypothetical protein